MANLSLDCASVSEFGAYEELGAVVVGFSFSAGQALEALIFQIDTPDSDQRADRYGMYVEIDGQGLYGVVRSFEYSREDHRVDVELDAAKSGGIGKVSLDLPADPGDARTVLVQKMVMLFRDYPALDPGL